MSLVNQSNSVRIYFVLWCLYYLQGSLYESGSSLSRALLAILLAVSGVHFFRSHKIGIPKSLKWLDLLLLLLLLYGFIGVLNGYVINVGGMTNIGYIKSVLVSFLPVYSFYYYTRKGEIDSKRLLIWAIALFVVYGLTFINHRIVEMNNPLMAAMGDAEETTNNAGYLVVSLVPFLIFFDKKPVIQYSLLALLLFITISSMKRGAMLVGAIMALILILYSMRGSKAWQKILTVVMIIIVGILGVRYVEYLLATSDFFNFRLEMTLEGDSSNRDDIYGFFLNYFLEQTNIVTFLFGSGANATVRIYGMFAHNDWLEIVIDQGLLGVVVYLCYWIALFKDWRQTYRIRKVYISLGLTLLYLLFRTFVSMSFLMVPLSCSILLGYGFAIRKDNLKIN